ncbi:MAG: XdhC/CoxI family protein [Acidobacteriaceae bacterium]
MDIYSEIVKLRSSGRRGAVATIINVRGSIPSFETAKMLVRDDGSLYGTIGGGCVEAEVWQAAREVMEEEKPRTLTFNLNNDPKYDSGLVCGGTLDIFIEPILPISTLYLFGAGHISRSLHAVARLAGFDAIIIDDRAAYANEERFPEARRIFSGDFDETMAKLDTPECPINETSYIVIVTRGHKDDMRILRWAAQTRARYIGMIGSQRKTIAIYRELVNQGTDPRLLERVHAPMGINIGAITPEEIAISVVAEMIGNRRNSTAALPHMKSRKAGELMVELGKNQPPINADERR